MQNFYSVIVTTETGPYVSRVFSTIKAARKWAFWCAKKWETSIYKGGAGGIKVQ